METINYNSTVSIVQGPSINFKGELKADSYEKVSITLPAKNHKVLNILPTYTEVIFLSIKASQYPPHGSPTLFYRVGPHEDSSSSQAKESSSKAGSSTHESTHHPKVILYNDHLYISGAVVHLLGKNLNTITFYNDGDEPVAMEILTCYNT